MKSVFHMSVTEIVNGINAGRVSSEGCLNVIFWHGYIYRVGSKSFYQLWGETLIPDPTGYIRAYYYFVNIPRKKFNATFSNIPDITYHINKIEEMLLRPA